MSNTKYYYVSASCVRFIEIPGLANEKEDDHNGLPFENNSPDADNYSPKFQERGGKKVFPMVMVASTIYPALNGLFVPASVEAILKAQTGSDEVSINMIRELSEEEYEADKKVRQAQKEFAASGNKLPNSVSSEIDDLIERASSGQLRAIAPDKNEHPNKEWDGTVDNEDDLFV